ncbi:HAD-IA family hydrolase [Latilactobacillus graminis]|uniref:HAD-superhydrolase, subIA, variant 3 family protein n=2 Tax=Latilactobacillus graminis TaxID=60519 RepID=A0AA89KY51_9LACO|nr:HAD-IA family hydrolase [Latilactobacillus graminis]KRM24025.1 HAD-superhydrolase, subIA, variant 3 family protein [Latilactobacillus graminis DSM 20719]QFP80343.1 HAD-IA family hydrolase [Latilactobacillus graminis]
MRYQNAIWDFDGTLYDTYPAMMAALVQVYRQHQVAVDSKQLYQTIKQTSIKRVLQGLAQQTEIAFEQLDQEYHQLEQKLQQAPQPYPGAATILQQVSLNGQNFLLTHRDSAAERFLAADGLIDYFTAIITSQAGFARKPAPDSLNTLCEQYQLDKIKTVMIGDRELDIQAGINAQVATAYFDIDHLPITVQPTLTITQLGALKPYF